MAGLLLLFNNERYLSGQDVFILSYLDFADNRNRNNTNIVYVYPVDNLIMSFGYRAEVF